MRERSAGCEPVCGLSGERLRTRLEPPPGGKMLDVVVDTDTYNEVDDQFAVAQALLSVSRLRVEAFYAAPFHNDRSSGPGDGMRRSLGELERVMGRLGVAGEKPVLAGAEGWMSACGGAVDSEAARDLVDRAMARSVDGPPLYVLAIGAPTNIASALWMEPGIGERIVLVWLGGNAHDRSSAREFNLRQDLLASQTLYDCGVPLVQVPCGGVAEHLVLTRAMLKGDLQGRSAIGDYLAEIVLEYIAEGTRNAGDSKIIWDIGAVAWLLEPAWVPTVVVPSPVLTDDLRYERPGGRPMMRVATGVESQTVFADLFEKLAGCAD